MAKKTKFSRTDVRGHTDAITKKGRQARGGGFDPSLKRVFHQRIVALLGVFCFVILVYAINLVALQAAGNAYSVYDPLSEVTVGEVRTVTLQAPRGEIYDRNGNKLVTNATSYSLVLDYNAFYSMGGMEMRNRALLSLLQTLRDAPEKGTDESHSLTPAQELFPLQGEYPSLVYSDAAKDADSETGQALRRTLTYLGAEGSSAQEIVQYYVTMYALDARVDGIPLYSDDEILTLIRTYYNMDRCAFSPAQGYVFASEVGVSLLNELQKKSLQGLQFLATQTRLHVYEGYASHVLGELLDTIPSNPDFCNALGYPVNEIKGKSGCEGAFDAYLQGEDGEMIVTFDTRGNILSREVTRQAIAGRDVYLTLDIELQKAAEDALRVNISTISNTGGTLSGADCDAGSVVAMDPESGEILAMASYPTYNNIIGVLLPEDGSAASPYINRAISAQYAPSQLFHLCTALTALDRSMISADTLLRDEGSFAGERGDILCPLSEQFDVSHESLSLGTALCDGCSVFFATLGSKMDISYLNAYARALGLGQATGIELAEQVGSLAGADLLSEEDSSMKEQLLPYAATGSGGTLCTPLQLCSMLSTVITGGSRYGVHLFRDARSYVSGTILEQGKATVLSQMRLSRADVTLLKESMQSAALSNTLLMERTAQIRNDGVSIGYLGAQSASGTMNSRDSLVLSYGCGERGDITVCVALEHGANPTLATPTIAAVFNQFYGE